MHKKQSCSHKIIFLFQICIPIKEDPYYKCICKAGYESDKRTGKTDKCVIANRSQFLLYGQQKPGVVRGLDIKSPDQVSRVRFIPSPALRGFWWYGISVFGSFGKLGQY